MSKYSADTNVKNNFGNLINEIRNSLDTHLQEMLSKMFLDADNKLFDLADNADSNEDQNRYFELMRVLRKHKQDISTNFLSNIKVLLKPFAETGATSKNLTTANEDELSLVGQDEMDGMVMIKSVGSNAAGKFREAISHLEVRLEHLALKTPDIFSKNALEPINFCQTFDDALGNRFDIANKKFLFQLFDDNIASRLGTIYDAINNLLIDAGVLPKIKLHAKQSASKQRPVPPAKEYTDTGDEGDGLDQSINQGGYAMTAAPGHANRGSGYRGSEEVASPYRGKTSPQGGSQGTPGGSSNTGGEHTDSGGVASTHPGGMGQQDVPQGAHGATAASDSNTGNSGATDSEAPGTGNYQHNTAGMPASQVSQAIGNYLGTPISPGAMADNEPSESYPAATPQYYGHDDILAALSSLQIQPEFSSSGELKFDAEAIKQAVLTEIAKTSGGVVTKRINRIAEKTIDFIELIFDAIIEDEDISDTIKTLLLRLQIPIIKASMVDQEFFIYDDHPARVLLDRIAEVGIGVTEHSDEIYLQLDKIISKLVGEFELQTSSFQNTLDSLNTFINEREEISRNKEEETQRQVLREHARSTVLKSLRSITTGKTLPESIHALVLKRWPTLMYNHYLNHGKENDEWVTIVEILRDIIDSVQLFENIDDLNHLLSTKDKLIEATLTHLNRTNQSKKDIETVIQGLKDTHQLHIDNADFSEEETEPEYETEEKADAQEEQAPEQETQTEVATQEEKTHELETTGEEPPCPQLPPDIMPGMWFQIYMGEDSTLRRGKLSVIIIQESKLVFVSYQGDIIVEKSFEEFSNELEESKSKIIMGHSVFDHALSRVITRLNT